MKSAVLGAVAASAFMGPVFAVQRPRRLPRRTRGPNPRNFAGTWTTPRVRTSAPCRLSPQGIRIYTPTQLRTYRNIRLLSGGILKLPFGNDSFSAERLGHQVD